MDGARRNEVMLCTEIIREINTDLKAEGFETSGRVSQQILSDQRLPLYYQGYLHLILTSKIINIPVRHAIEALKILERLRKHSPSYSDVTGKILHAQKMLELALKHQDKTRKLDKGCEKARVELREKQASRRGLATRSANLTTTDTILATMSLDPRRHLSNAISRDISDIMLREIGRDEEHAREALQEAWRKTKEINNQLLRWNRGMLGAETNEGGRRI